jgi:hypothetical protein
MTDAETDNTNREVGPLLAQLIAGGRLLRRKKSHLDLCLSPHRQSSVWMRFEENREERHFF